MTTLIASCPVPALLSAVPDVPCRRGRMFLHRTLAGMVNTVPGSGNPAVFRALPDGGPEGWKTRPPGMSHGLTAPIRDCPFRVQRRGRCDAG